MTSASPQTPRVVYVSYDGMGEPLGRSQVIGYLSRLAGSHAITLISFEKPGTPRAALRSELSALGIDWRPHRYLRRPPVLSTLLDIVRGSLAIRRAVRRDRAQIVHVRSYVPALMALLAIGPQAPRLLFDIRGFWADERVDGGLWSPNGRLYRIAKRCERRFFARADAVVTLTEASVPEIRRLLAGRAVPVVVIPTCVDPRPFAAALPRAAASPAAPPRAVWAGSVGTWYRFDLVAPLAEDLGMGLTVLTRETALARELLGPRMSAAADVRTVSPGEVAAELHPGDIGLCLIASKPSKVASAPTRFAEYLAAGMAVVVTPGIGDLEQQVTENAVGVVLRGEDAAAIARAAHEVRELAAQPDTAERCRRLAAEHFDVDVGAAQYAELYRRLAG